jgi:hypothetical protein
MFRHSHTRTDADFDRKFVGPPRIIPYSELPSAIIKRLAEVLTKRFDCDGNIMAAHLQTVKAFQSWKALQVTDGGDRIQASLHAHSVDDSRDASWCLVSTHMSSTLPS